MGGGGGGYAVYTGMIVRSSTSVIYFGVVTDDLI